MFSRSLKVWVSLSLAQVGLHAETKLKSASFLAINDQEKEVVFIFNVM